MHVKPPRKRNTAAHETVVKMVVHAIGGQVAELLVFLAAAQRVGGSIPVRGKFSDQKDLPSPLSCK